MFSCRDKFSIPLDKYQESDCLFLLVSVLADCLFQGIGAWRSLVGFSPWAKSRTRLSDFTFTFHFHALEKEMQPTQVFLPGESQGWGSLVRFRLWGRTELDTTEAT